MLDVGGCAWGFDRLDFNSLIYVMDSRKFDVGDLDLHKTGLWTKRHAVYCVGVLSHITLPPCLDRLTDIVDRTRGSLDIIRIYRLYINILRISHPLPGFRIVSKIDSVQ